jgi:hypothetical protein
MTLKFSPKLPLFEGRTLMLSLELLKKEKIFSISDALSAYICVTFPVEIANLCQQWFRAMGK